MQKFILVALLSATAITAAPSAILMKRDFPSEGTQDSDVATAPSTPSIGFHPVGHIGSTLAGTDSTNSGDSGDAEESEDEDDSEETYDGDDSEDTSSEGADEDD